MNAETRASLNLKSLSDYSPGKYVSRNVKPRCDVINGRLPRGKVVLLAGEGGVGKSMVLLHLFVAITQGHFGTAKDKRDFFGGSVNCGSLPCAMVFAEDDGDTVAIRLKQIAGKNMPDIGMILPLPDLGPLRLMERNYIGASPEPTAFFEWLDESLEMIKTLHGGIGLLGIDPFAALFGIDENNAGEVQQVWAHLTNLAARHDVCIVVTHHLRKGGNQDRAAIRGSTALVDGVRAAYVMTLDESPHEVLRQLNKPTDAKLEVLQISLIKDNLGLHKGRITLVRNPDGSLMDVTGELQAWLTPEQAMLKVVLEANQAARKITKSGKLGMFASRAESWPEVLKNLSRAAMEMMVQELLNTGKLQQGFGGSLTIPESSK